MNLSHKNAYICRNQHQTDMSKLVTIEDENGRQVQVRENEINRSILLDRLEAFSDAEQDSEEKELLQDLKTWLENVPFVED